MKKSHQKQLPVLFKPKPNSWPDIMFATHCLDVPLEALCMFAHAYYDAAELFFQQIMKGLNKEDRYAEDRIFPALFLFRHCVELYLKAMIIYCLEIKNPYTVFKSPNLKDVFEEHRLGFLYKRLQEVWPNQTRKPLSTSAEKILNQLIQVDNKSAAFRYPFGAGFKAILPARFQANSADIWDKLEELGSELYGRLEGLVQWAEGNSSNRD